MSSRLRQIFAATQPTSVEAADRRRQLAEAMQVRALQGTKTAPEHYTPATALTDLASNLVSAYGVKKANAAYGRAKDAKSQQTSEALKRYASSVPDSQVGAVARNRIMDPSLPANELPEPVEPRSAAYGGLVDTLEPDAKAQLTQALVAQQISPKGSPSKGIEEYEYAKQQGFQGSFEDWIVKGGQSSRPSSVQEWEFFNNLSAKDQDRYLVMKRSQMQKVEDLAGGKSVVTASPLGNVSTTGLTSQAQEVDAAGNLARATGEAGAAGKVTGDTATTAKFDLPRVEDGAAQTLSLLDRLEKHPGRKLATGASSAIPLDKIPGTEARDFVALLGQLRGKQFLEAFNMLKGGGQITEVEGAKAESAIATIQDRGQSEESYVQAIHDLRDVVNQGVKRARQKAGQANKAPAASPSSPAPANVINFADLPN